MHPLLTLASAAVGIYTGVRLARRMHAKYKNGGSEKPATAENDNSREPRDLGELKLDQHAGVYRPKNS